MWVEVRDKSELRSGSVVELRVVDLLVVDVRFDMDEVDSHRVVSDWDLGCHTRHDLGFGLRG